MYNLIVGGLISRGEYSTFSPIPTKLTGVEVLSMKKTCKVTGCNNKHKGLDYCQKHLTRLRKYGDPLYTKTEQHGLTKTGEYKSWIGMKSRCYNSNYPWFNRWGGRGITICDQWLNSFEKFLKDMGNKPSTKHQIDRENNDIDYTPDNCRWVLAIVNTQNRSTTKLTKEDVHKIKHNYNKMTRSDIAKLYNVTASTIGSILRGATWKNIT